MKAVLAIALVTVLASCSRYSETSKGDADSRAVIGHRGGLVIHSGDLAGVFSASASSAASSAAEALQELPACASAIVATQDDTLQKPGAHEGTAQHAGQVAACSPPPEQAAFGPSAGR